MPMPRPRSFRHTLAAGLAALALSVAVAPARAEVSDAGADPALTQQPDAKLVAMLPADVAKSKVLVVGVSLGSPPDDFRNEKGETVGWEIDILRAATQSLGLQLDIRPTTFDTLIPGLQAKRFDAAVGQMGVTTVRQKVLDMIGTLLGNELFAALSTTDIKVNSLDDICGLNVATTRGSREYEFAMTHNPICESKGKKPINMMVFNDGNGAAEAVMSRRADLFWLGSTTVGYFVGQGKGKTKVVGSYTDTSYIGVGMPKGSEMAQPLQAAIQHIIDNGTYTKIVTKWGLADGAVKQAPLNPTGTPR